MRQIGAVFELYRGDLAGADQESPDRGGHLVRGSGGREPLSPGTFTDHRLPQGDILPETSEPKEAQGPQWGGDEAGSVREWVGVEGFGDLSVSAQAHAGHLHSK